VAALLSLMYRFTSRWN